MVSTETSTANLAPEREAETEAGLDLALATGVPWPQLGGVAFGVILSAIDRARPGPGAERETALYTAWLGANPQAPLAWAGWFNCGIVLAQNGDLPNAITAYQNALALRPDLHCAAINLGLLHESRGQPEQALAVWHQALQPAEVRIALQIQQGRLLEKTGRYEEAEQMLRAALISAPEQPDVLHHWVHLRQKTCLWPVALPENPALGMDAVLQGSGPFGIMALSDDIALQRHAAATWVARKTEAAPEHLAPAAPYAHKRIRIGYMSSDFCRHAMSYLITELFERHDRARFEVYGYCSSLEDGSALRQRVLASFDHVRPIRDLSDEDAARLIRADEIDVLIDLNGITDGSRLAVLRWRPAPIQASYLGFVGPIPLPELDYLLCDEIVIPPEYAAAYHTAPLAVARIYQANDSQRSIGGALTRAALGLPEDAFIFCCFSKHYKITQEMFTAWLEILRHTSNSVLWLAQDNPYSQANLLATAKAAGIAPERLIFSERADPDSYMCRLSLADLFLDTFPYNAGTVASDAIRMQLPLITLCGRAFASRMATSMLHALGAEQGVATSFQDYAANAIRLATQPTDYAAYKALFTIESWSRTIGNIARFTTEFENCWERVVAVRRAQPNGETRMPPDQIVLHVGCGVAGPEKLPALFRQGGWREWRLDIDPGVTPDFIASLTDMRVVGDGGVDAVYSSHNVEHLYPHEVQPALREMRRVLKPEGFCLIKLPDMQEVAVAVAEGRLEEPLYISPMGPISPLDIMYGHRASMTDGNLFMAHRTGFTQATLGAALIEAGFASAMVQREPGFYCLTAIAFRVLPSAERQQEAQAALLKRGEPAMLYVQNSPAQTAFALAQRCLAQGQTQEAIDAYCKAIALQPDFPDAYVNLGVLVLSLGQRQEAIALFRRAIELNPHHALAHGNLGKALHDDGQLDAAVEAYRAALALHPGSTETLMNFGAALLDRQDWSGAETLTRQALALRPDSVLALANLGTALLRQGLHDDALGACLQAVALRPQGAEVQASLGGALLELGGWQLAAELCSAAIALNPFLPSAHFNLSHALKTLNRPEEAAQAARAAIALCPENAEYHFHLAHILLLQGDLPAGWAAYEWRWKLPEFAWARSLKLASRQWAGEDLSGKTILIYTEQGLGDIIQFARYLPLLNSARLAARAVQVVVAAHPPVRRLLESIKGISVVSLHDPLPPHDVHCPLLSLPGLFGTTLATIPAAVPYLHPDAKARARWARRLSGARLGGARLRVGIVWAGNPAVQRDRFRSPGLASVLPLFNVPGVDFYILQMGPGRAALAEQTLPPNVVDLGDEISNLTDTAAIMPALDLVISSCTSPLHLAGALGVQAWAMLPFAPHFPWLLGCQDSLWYPSLRLYRQDAPGRDWAGLVTRMAADLAMLAHDKAALAGQQVEEMV